MLLISHDRALLEAVGSRTVAVEDGTLRSYGSGWAQYQRDKEEQAELAIAGAAPPSSGNGGGKGAAKPKPNGPSKNKLRRIADLEKQIEKSERALQTLEDELADPSAWASPEKSEASTRRHTDLKRKIEELYEEWEEAGGVAAEI